MTSGYTIWSGIISQAAATAAKHTTPQYVGLATSASGTAHQMPYADNTIKKHWVRIITNTLDDVATAYVYKNGVSCAGLEITIPTGFTGILAVSADTPIADGDLLDVAITPGGSTVGTITGYNGLSFLSP